MNISMIPNNDVKTIHASQGDTQRVWNFVPYGENGVINTSQDEYASFDSIKGNTLVWNQLLTTNHSLTIATTDTATKVVENLIPVISGHKYLLLWTQNITLTSNTRNTPAYYIGTGSATYQNANTNANLSSGRKSWIFTVASSGNMTVTYWGYNPNAQFVVSDFNLIDLTLLGLDITYDEFVSYFPLSYYPYDSGSLLSFNGSGIKTTGKNLVSLALSPAKQQRVTGVTIQSQTNEEFTIISTGSGTYANLGLYYNLKKGTYTVKYQAEVSDSFAPIMTIYNGVTGQVITNSVPKNTARTFTLTEDAMVEIRCFATTTSAVRTVRFYDFQLEFGSTATAYDPYTESVLNLPISQYFPTGMKSVGSVYDELTPTKAITRVGSVDLGSLDWIAQTTAGGEYRMVSLNGISALAKHPASSSVKANLLCADYPTITADNVYLRNKGVSLTSSGGISIYDSSYNTQTSTEAFKTAMSGVYLYFELASESSVDIDEDLTYPVEVDGTEELLPSGLLNGVVDLGSLTWSYSSGGSGRFQTTGIASSVKIPSSDTGGNIFCEKYANGTASQVYSGTAQICIQNGSGQIWVYDPSFNGNVSDFTSAMQGVMLWYEKSDNSPSTTPIKADIRYPDGVQSVEFTYKQTEYEPRTITGSMVCKGLEIEGETDENGITIQSTSELTSEPGFFDCKLKLNNGGGVCYSSKFQLHVERRP